MWIRKDGAFKGIVPPETFLTAQNILIGRASRFTNEELIDKLRKLFEEFGRLSAGIINQAPDLPNSGIYAKRFGSLAQAYQLVGFRSQVDSASLTINRRLRRMHPEIIERAQTTIEGLGGTVWRDPKTDLLHLNRELIICLVLARCQTLTTGVQRWRIRPDPAKYSPDITVAIRMDTFNAAELDYYLLPQLDLLQQELHVTRRNSANFECFRFDNLEFFYGMSQRGRVQRRASIQYSTDHHYQESSLSHDHHK
jgi:hypothetical protein